MKYLLRWLRRQCPACGQKLNSQQTSMDRISQINARVERLTQSLGRRPQVQSCEKCQRIVFETEPGFVQSCLLIDLEYLSETQNQSAGQKRQALQQATV